MINGALLSQKIEANAFYLILKKKRRWNSITKLSEMFNVQLKIVSSWRFYMCMVSHFCVIKLVIASSLFLFLQYTFCDGFFYITVYIYIMKKNLHNLKLVIDFFLQITQIRNP